MLDTQTTSPAFEIPVGADEDQKKQARMNALKRNWWIYALLTLGLIVMIIPFIWMLLSSLKNAAELALVPPTWIPQVPTLDNFYRLFNNFNFPLYFLNSI